MKRWLMTAGLAWMVGSAWAAGLGPTIVIGQPGACIAPAEVMRRDHREMLQHQRQRSVRLGERGARVSLAGCIACHAHQAPGQAVKSVIGTRENFCQTCHAYVAVKLDCWDCHQPQANAQALNASSDARHDLR